MVYFLDMAHRFPAWFITTLIGTTALVGCTHASETANHYHDTTTPMYAQLCENTFTHTRARDEYCAIDDASQGEMHTPTGASDTPLDSPYAAVWVPLNDRTPDILPAISESLDAIEHSTRTPPTGDVHIITVDPDGTYELEP